MNPKKGFTGTTGPDTCYRFKRDLKRFKMLPAGTQLWKTIWGVFPSVNAVSVEETIPTALPFISITVPPLEPTQ
jgi:hypothetical protein